VKIKQSWADGVNTISVNDYSFGLIDGGSKLAFADQTFSLNDRRRTVLVAEDGSTRIIEEGQASWTGWWVGILGAVLGLGGGIFGTYCSIKNTKTPAEKRFMIRYGVAGWLALVLLVFVPLALRFSGVIPAWLEWALFALFFVLLLPSIRWANRRQAALRQAGGQNATG
jgi:hypothetical protein